MQISYFYGVSHTTPIYKDIDDIFNEIKDGTHKQLIDSCRNAIA